MANLAPLVTVACGSCRLCCRNQDVSLSLQHGDDPRIYETVIKAGPGGEVVHYLKRQPNGDCIYLGAQGCTIWPNHPVLCRIFDCAQLYERVPAEEQRKLIADGTFNAAVLEAGRLRSAMGRGEAVGAPDALSPAPAVAGRDLGALDFWRNFAPQLHIADASFMSRYSAFGVSPAQRESMAAQVAREGYVQASVDWELDLDLMANTVRALCAADLSPVFAFLYDEFWIPFYRLNFVISGLLGGKYFMLPDFWIWNVDPRKGESGWAPHRDKGHRSLFADGSPMSVTAWVPLSQATPLNSCMYVVPAMLDPTYGTENDRDFKFDYASIRALPAQPGDFFIWNQALLHWGSKSSERGEMSRVSVSFEFQRADVKAFNEPLIDPLSLLPFELRLKMIAKQVMQYRQMYALPPEVEQFALGLAS
jgi:Fe-S-cluster containining protein